MIHTNLKIPNKVNPRDYIIEHVANYLSNNFTFGYYTREDIKQEAWIISLEVLAKDSYNGSIPLENFLIIHVKNRLINLKRDKYARKTLRQDARKALMNPAPDQELIHQYEHSSKRDSLLEYEELSNLILCNLDSDLHADYHKLCEGFPIPERRRQVVRTAVLEILEQHGYES